jgi:hypothetical protein
VLLEVTVRSDVVVGVRHGPRVAINPRDGRHYAFPGFVINARGEFLVAYRDADDHYVRASRDRQRDRGVIRLQRSLDHGNTWSPSVVIQDDGLDDSRDPALAVLANGQLVLSYFVYAGEIVTSFVRISSDHGDTWAPAVEVAHGFAVGSAVCAPVAELADGGLLIPLFGRFRDEADISCTVSRSDDGGASWRHVATIATGGGLQWTEPNLVVLSGGEVVCLIRQNASPRHIFVSRSDDGGASWSAPSQAFEGNGRPAVIEAADGCVVAYRSPAGHTACRYSFDMGSTWGPEVCIDETGTYDYAQMALGPGGSLYLAYAVELSRSESNVFMKRLEFGRRDVATNSG